jgi:hypothetical protein
VDVLEAWENCSMMWRTDATDCAYDLFSFMEEQIEVAKSNPADQLAAIDAASGAIRIVEKRQETHKTLPQLLVLTGDFASLRRRFNELATMDRTEFEAKVGGVLEAVGVAKSLI